MVLTDSGVEAGVDSVLVRDVVWDLVSPVMGVDTVGLDTISPQSSSSSSTVALATSICDEVSTLRLFRLVERSGEDIGG